MRIFNQPAQTRGAVLRDAVLTMAVVLLAYCALDDITTDNGTTFRVEWTVLVLCAAWLLAVSWRLVRSEHRRLAYASSIVLVVTTVAASTIGINPSVLAYLVTLAGLVWFLGVAVTLAGRAWRLAH